LMLLMRFSQAYMPIGIALMLLIGASSYALYHKDMTSSKPLASVISSTPEATSTLTLSSPAFTDGASIPATYTCDGDGSLSPTLRISGVPAGAKSLALIVGDPDIPAAVKSQLPDDAGGVYVHWIVFNIAATTTEIKAGETPGVLGANGSDRNAYTGPCPPRQYMPNEHRYYFTLYALDTELPLSPGASRAQVLSAMVDHILAETTLLGRYQRL